MPVAPEIIRAPGGAGAVCPDRSSSARPSSGRAVPPAGRLQTFLYQTVLFLLFLGRPAPAALPSRRNVRARPRGLSGLEPWAGVNPHHTNDGEAEVAAGGTPLPAAPGRGSNARAGRGGVAGTAAAGRLPPRSPLSTASRSHLVNGLRPQSRPPSQPAGRQLGHQDFIARLREQQYFSSSV